MEHQILLALSGIIVMGVLSEWIAWRLKVPSILILLLGGFFIGPVLNLVHPDAIFGKLLFPSVSLSVAIILFEGGLSLNLSELRSNSRVIYMLISVGMLVTLLAATLAAKLLLGLDFEIALMLGAILVVTGPTVIVPLLRYVRPSRKIADVLRWEGIIIDPIGAMLAVLVFEVIRARYISEAAVSIILIILNTLAVGGIVGGLSALILIIMIKKHWIPEYLESIMALMIIIAAYSFSNMLQTEAGLLTVTVAGIVLANQKQIAIRGIKRFKENLRVLLICCLFIILAARVNISDIRHIGIGGAAFIVVMILIVRPLAVWTATIRSSFAYNERAFLAWIAPRGIVAAAVSSIFSMRLTQMGYSQAEILFPITFLMIITTVVLASLTATPVAIRLKVAQADPQGVLLVGAHAWARNIARALQSKGFRVQIVDTQWKNITAARQAGIEAYWGSILSEDIKDAVNLEGIGRMIALTSNDNVNSLASLNLLELFGREQVFQLDFSEVSIKGRNPMPLHLHGRLLFSKGLGFNAIDDYFKRGAEIKTTTLTPEFDYRSYLDYYGRSVIPLFLIRENGKLHVWTPDNQPTPKPGQTIISIIDPKEKNEELSSGEAESGPEQNNES